MVEACVENGASCIDISGEPQVCDSKKPLPYIKAVQKECLFSMFHGFDSVSEHEDKFCLPIYNFKMQ